MKASGRNDIEQVSGFTQLGSRVILIEADLDVSIATIGDMNVHQKLILLGSYITLKLHQSSELYS